MLTDLSGQIERITFTNEENGFTIAKVRVKGKRDLITVIGNLMAPMPGEILDMQGEWAVHPKFGEQFKVSQFKTRVPATVHGIKKYLGSGLIKGLGPVMAGRIVDRFGDKTLSGRPLGHFVPRQGVTASDECPYSKEELQRMRAEQTGRPLSEIWKSLGAGTASKSARSTARRRLATVRSSAWEWARCLDRKAS